MSTGRLFVKYFGKAVAYLLQNSKLVRSYREERLKVWYFRSLSTAYLFCTHHAPIAILLFTTAHTIDQLDKSLSCGYDKGAKQAERRLYTVKCLPIVEIILRKQSKTKNRVTVAIGRRGRKSFAPVPRFCFAKYDPEVNNMTLEEVRN